MPIFVKRELMLLSAKQKGSPRMNDLRESMSNILTEQLEGHTV